ncbi:MAG: suppressor of loss of ypt1 [Candelina submexicana]|nr:MAG: suppressor of loss of ypt1 [Candelina submexicana]
MARMYGRDLQQTELHGMEKVPLTGTGPDASADVQNGFIPSERWQPRKENVVYWGNGSMKGAGSRHGRQKSLSDAFKTIRTRRGSVSANAHEIADALKAPISLKLTILCIIWYITSALTNTSTKSILNAFSKPVTLTLIQFGFVSSWCVVLSLLASIYPPLRVAIPALKHSIRSPGKEVISTTLPLAAFQVGGHILSSTATSTIPVSLVHTIKGLSPLFTVLAYRLIFSIHHSIATYMSLIPLTLGVMLACSAEFSGHLFGILCAFGGAVIFVTQNIFSKKLFNEAARAEADGQFQRSRKLDKLNLLCYSSGLAFLLTAPLWLWSEGFDLLRGRISGTTVKQLQKSSTLSSGRLALEFLFNGTFHFGQNIMAFVLLSMVSPVTYSVASLVKRIFVIVVAIFWFGNKTTTPVQAIGIALTFLGLYLYDRTSDAAKTDRVANSSRRVGEGTLLPLVMERTPSSSPAFTESPMSAATGQVYGGANGSFTGLDGSEKRIDAAGPGRPRALSAASPWLPGSKQEDTWRSKNSPVHKQ